MVAQGGMHYQDGLVVTVRKLSGTERPRRFSKCGEAIPVV
ncbi:MAG: hypothetical protein RLZZ179_3149 [Verrucomicrobiota bacterium]|jgi:hypothetical protein